VSVDGSLELREIVRARDAVDIEAMVAATGFFNEEELAIARELVDERLTHGADSGYEFLFAQAGDALVGYACWGRTPQTADGWDLYWIVVDPRFQGGGVGARLLAEVERRIREGGGGSVWVETAGRAQYAPTRAFYERRGYTCEARLGNFYAPGDDKIVYVKRVT